MSVSIEEIVEAPIAEIWTLIGDFANLRRWHPLVLRTETTGEGEGAIRTVHFDGWWAAERLDHLDDAHHKLAYSVVDSSRPETIGVHGTIALTPLSEGRTRINWSSGLDASNPHAAAVNAGLAVYYPARIGHLRQALRLADER